MTAVTGCTGEKEKPADAFTEEEYNGYKLPERISELPSNEQITKDIDNGIVYLTYMYEDLSGGETTFTYYKFTDLPQLETRTWAQRNETRFRGEYKLEAEIIPVRGLQILVNPWVTVFEPGVYGLFEKEIMKLSFEATENRPAGNYANWRLTNAAGGETTYAVYVDGKVTKTKVNADGSGTFEIASSTISEECAAFFYGRNMMLGTVNKEEDDDSFLDGSYGAAQSLYVRKDGEVKLLSVEQSAALLEALGCKKSDQGYRGYVVSVYHEVNVKPGEDKKELFRFKEATPSMETESGYADPDENYEFWYRVYEDGTVACFREGYGYVMERPFIVSVRLRRIERFSNTGDAEKALAAIS